MVRKIIGILSVAIIMEVFLCSICVAGRVVNPYYVEKAAELGKIEKELHKMARKMGIREAEIDEALDSKFDKMLEGKGDKAEGDFWGSLLLGSLIEATDEAQLEKKHKEYIRKALELEEIPRYVYNKSDFSHWQNKCNPGAQSCFIATAAYGTPFEQEVVLLREFRDAYLLTDPLGKSFVRLYYKTSPTIADFIGKSNRRRKFTRVMLAPIVKMANWSLKNTDSR